MPSWAASASCWRGPLRWAPGSGCSGAACWRSACSGCTPEDAGAGLRRLPRRVTTTSGRAGSPSSWRPPVPRPGVRLGPGRVRPVLDRRRRPGELVPPLALAALAIALGALFSVRESSPAATETPHRGRTAVVTWALMTPFVLAPLVTLEAREPWVTLLTVAVLGVLTAGAFMWERRANRVRALARLGAADHRDDAGRRAGHAPGPAHRRAGLRSRRVRQPRRVLPPGAGHAAGRARIDRRATERPDLDRSQVPAGPHPVRGLVGGRRQLPACGHARHRGGRQGRRPGTVGRRSAYADARGRFRRLGRRPAGDGCACVGPGGADGAGHGPRRRHPRGVLDHPGSRLRHRSQPGRGGRRPGDVRGNQQA